VPSTARDLWDHAMIAMLIGCGLRRAELLALRFESIQQREEHWVIADLVGKAGHMCALFPIPTWVKAAVDAWTAAAAITDGPVFRAINFLSVKVLSRVFGGKFVEALRCAYDRKELELAGGSEHLRDPAAWRVFVGALFETDWVVYAKPAVGSATAVLGYLGRYTHPVAIAITA
jgi:hypothetical protein